MTNTNASNQIRSIRNRLAQDLQDRENIRLMVQRATERNLVEQDEDNAAMDRLCAAIAVM